MTQNLLSLNLMRPLSIGNIVNVSINLYRSHFKLYLKLSLLAYLWLLVPLYGWAKFLAISALISRLAFCELMGQPESVREAGRYIRPRIWTFLCTAILLFIILFFVLMLSFIVTGLFLSMTRMEEIIAPLEAIADDKFIRKNILIAFLFLIFLILILLVFLVCLFVPTLWIYSRFFIAELPLSSENNINLITSLCRSWELTKGYFWKLQRILMLAIFIILPMQILFYFLGEIVNIFTSQFMAGLNSKYPLIDTVLIEMLSWGITLFNAVIFMPFFQLIKAVVYYNLRLRREGLGVRLPKRAC